MTAGVAKSLNRESAMQAFLAKSGWGDAQLLPLKGDASFRRYIRLQRGADTAMLMDAPPEKENIVPYVRVARRLHGLGFSAPEVLAEDAASGLLICEDLGDDLFTRVLAHGGDEATFYDAAVDVLAAWHAEPKMRKGAGLPTPERSTGSAQAGELPDYNTKELMREVGLFAEWFLPAALGEAKAAGLHDEYLDIWQRLLERAKLPCEFFVHRDYHADNLLWLPEREGEARVGLLDFQDALWGHAAYDLVSLLEDARRDLKPGTAARCLKRYLAATGEKESNFTPAYALLAAQRNSKIVGIFCRLARRDNKHAYLSFLPRVWAHLEHDLSHPMLAELKSWTDKHVPKSVRGELKING